MKKMGAFGALTGAYSYGPNMITSVIHSFLSFIVDLLCLDTNLDTWKKNGYFLDTFERPVRYLANFEVTDTAGVWQKRLLG